MARSFFISIALCFVMLIEALSQSLNQPGISTYSYHPPSADKLSWQRLNLWLSSTFILAVREGQIDLDSCLYMASRSLGLSRFSILAEGIDDPQLFAQSQWVDRREPGDGLRLAAQSTGRKHLQLLILLGSYYAFQPGSYYRYRDSVEYFLIKAVNESRVLKDEKLGRQALCLLGKLYTQAGDKKGDTLFNQLINECGRAGDKETEARALAYRGIYTPVSPRTAIDKITALQKAADLYRTLNNPEGEINVLTDIGYLSIITGQLQLAYEKFLKALQLAESIRYPYTHYNTDLLNLVTASQGKFGEPFMYSLQTIKTSESNRDSIGWGYFYLRQSLLYKLEGREKESRDMVQKAIERFIIDRNPHVYNILNDHINALAGEGRQAEALEFILGMSKKVDAPVTFTDQFFYHLALSNCYIHLDKLEQAEMHLAIMDSLETKAEAIRGAVRRIVVNDQYAYINFKRRQYQKAREYFENHFKITSVTNHYLAEELRICRFLIRIDSLLGDKASGLAHYKQYTALLDSNFRVTKIRQAEELQVLYQTQEKENQIAALNQKSKLEQANLKQATLVKNLTIAGIIAVLIIAGLLYRQNRQKQRNNNVIMQKNEQLRHYLTEKEWLLKEIHHRVKNNLQIVMSLLNSQSAYINNEPALTAIHDSQHRVHAMSLIHQKLYSSENVSSINMLVYIRELVTYLSDSFDTGKRIRFELNIEPLEMDVSQSVPLGLILNEAITNSIKYAFPGDRSGIISISLLNTAPDQYLLTISDNGIGMPADPAKTGSLGMSLMKGLSEDLDGSFSIETNNGTTVKVSFVYDMSDKKHSLLAGSLVSNI
jgi:two-component sensor histidine kinase